MPVFVSKFGGTSLADGERFENVFDIVRAHPARRVAVVSAPGKTAKGEGKITDLLALAFDDRDRDVFSRVRSRYSEIARRLGIDFEKELSEAEDIVLRENDRARALSMGEFLSAKLFSAGTGYYFADAREHIFFKNGSVDEEKTQSALMRMERDHTRCVIPGFYGSDENGRICLFPRGGGDITGAVAAYFLHADLYENWTDVDGIYDRDPNVYKDARVLSRLTYEEAEAILSSGASVLHADCLPWARRSGMKIRIRNTFSPEAAGSIIG